MQRIKNQQNALNVLEQRYSEASNQHDTLLERIRQKSSDSEKLISSLRIREQQNTRDLKNYLYPLYSNDQNVSSPSLNVTSLHNIDPSLSPSDNPLSNSSWSLKRPRKSLTVSTSADLTQIPVDPAMELVFSRFLHSLRSSEAQIASNRAELQRCKFTEDSQNGKRMMSRLRVLERENAELEAMCEGGRPAKVANLMALRRRHLARLHKENARSEKLLDDVESEVEVFTNTLTMLQQQLSIANATIEVLAVALANCSSSDVESALPSSPTAYQRCIELLRSSDWSIPESLREYSAASAPLQPQNNDCGQDNS